MTEPDLQLEYNELLARAAELEVPLADVPSVYPNPPCRLDMIVKASEALALSVDNIGVYLKAAEKARKDLATSLRNAAKAYEDTDESSADSIEGGGGSSSESGGADDDQQPSGPMLGAWYDPSTWGGQKSHKIHVTEPDTNPDDYADLQVRAHQIAEPDQGLAFIHFADSWDAYRRVLLDSRNLYRTFEYWKGEAASAVELNLRQTLNWMLTAADTCGTISDQARKIAAAHKVAVREHPTSGQLAALDQEYLGNIYDRNHAMNQYAEYQKKSDEVLQKYTRDGGLPLGSQMLSEPPTPYPIAPPTPTPTPGPTPSDPTDPQLSDFTQPATPVTPDGGMSQAEEPGEGEFSDELMDGSVVSAGGVRPASFGGPSSPLKPAAGHDSMAHSAAAAATVPRAPGLGGAMGGAGMGTPPMGAGSAGKDGKTVHTDDEELLYEEKRSWTEAVIGARRKKDIVDNIVSTYSESKGG